MVAEKLSESKRCDVRHCRRENYVANEAVGVASVRDKSEVTKHPADVNKTDNGERYVSQLAASAIAQNWDEQDQRNRERRHGDKESVPTRARIFAARIRNYGSDADHNDSGINCCGHPRVTTQSRCLCEFLESVDRKQRNAHDCWNPPEKNNDETDSGNENPQQIGLGHRRGFFLQNEPEKAYYRAGDCERNQNDPEVSAKNRIVQRDVWRHHRLSCSAAMMRFKRTTIVSTQPAMTARQVQS